MSLIVELVLCLSRAAFADAPFPIRNGPKRYFRPLDFTMTRVNDGYSISIVSMKGAAHITQNMLCDSTLATRQWHYKSDQNTDISLCRNGDCIEVSGVFQGNPVKKNLPSRAALGARLSRWGWKQRPATLPDAQIYGPSVSTPAVLKAVCFHIDKISNTPLSDHPEIRCTCSPMSIKGLPCQI